MPSDPTLPPLFLTVEDRAARKREDGSGRGDGEASVAAYGRIAAELFDASFARLRAARGAGNAAARETIRETSGLILDLAAELRTIDEGFRHHGEPVDVARLLRKAVRLLRHMASVPVPDAHRAGVRVSGCSGRLYEALLDLGLNARDAMSPRGDLAFGLDARWSTDPKSCFPGVPPRYAVLSVQDDGRGMPEPILRDLLGASLEQDSAGAVQHPGLWRVHCCVEAHRGWIELDTAPGQGTKFQILLPLA